MARAVKLDCSLAASCRYLLFFSPVAVFSMAFGRRFRLMFVVVHGCLTVVSVNEGSAPGKNFFCCVDDSWVYGQAREVDRQCLSLLSGLQFVNLYSPQVKKSKWVVL